MAKRMLVDATQPEETRVVVVSGNRLEELDFEIASRKQLKGNIYLAKVTRVEPSLQAAFVEYGGNRHGFLAFSEIHPDYYRIPVADREALLAEERRLAELADEADDEAPPPRRVTAGNRRQAGKAIAGDDSESAEVAPAEDPIGHSAESGALGQASTGGEPPDHQTPIDQAPTQDDPAHDNPAAGFGDGENAAPRTVAVPAAFAGETLSDEVPAGGIEHSLAFEDGALPEAGEIVAPDRFYPHGHEAEAAPGAGDVGDAADAAEAVNLDVIGGDEVEEMVRRRPRPLRSYKIQEVIKRRQILLVQVTKEERGTKGAALTTYLSLPGRYCVLMPNTGRGGGVSRKITNPQDRKRLKEMLSDLDVPQGMAVILRTAGLERSKAEIKRDLEYLLRLWDSIREQTLQSTAPELIYEEANLIKRSIRDLYANDIDEVLVEGDEGYRLAKDFMRMLVPSHIKRVQQYRDETIPLFFRYQVETQIDAIHGPIVQLKSGGYIVINPTEALVAIDVNSGRSTRERNIEETAFKTNLEASDEIARQLRLRDLAGLIVIDYIDMEDNRNNLAVERRLKEAMKTDRARIQLGRISPFGLLELSRQRMRPSLLETNFERCPHCSGAGVIRSIESAALHTLRAVEEEGIRRRSAEITVAVTPTVALYILNYKRVELAHIEQRYAMRVAVLSDESLIIPELRVERVRVKGPGEELVGAITTEKVFAEAERLVDADVEDEEDEEAGGPFEAGTTVTAPRAAESRSEDGGDEGRERRGGRRGRRGRRRPGSGDQRPVETTAAPVSTPDVVETSGPAGEGDEVASGETITAGVEIGSDGQQRKRRRGKRGGRRRGRGREGGVGEGGAVSEAETGEMEAGTSDDGDADLGPETETNHERQTDGTDRAITRDHAPNLVTLAPAASQPMDSLPVVEDFDWLLDDDRPIAATLPAETAGAEPGLEPGQAGTGETVAAQALAPEGEPTTENFPVAAETGAADVAGPRRRSRRRGAGEGEVEAAVVRRTRRRVKMAPDGEEAQIEVAAEVAPGAAAEIMQTPPPEADAPAAALAEPTQEVVHEAPGHGNAVREPVDGTVADGTVAEDDTVAVAPTERPDEAPAPMAEIVTDAPLPAPSRDAVADATTPPPPPCASSDATVTTAPRLVEQGVSFTGIGRDPTIPFCFTERSGRLVPDRSVSKPRSPQVY